MKRFILILMLAPVISFGQKKDNGYGYIAIGGFLSKGDAALYPSLGIGFSSSKNVSLGASFYYHKEYKFSTMLDIRALFKGVKKTTPFISVQPGLNFYRNTIGTGTNTVTTKGSFAFNGLFGVMGKGKGKAPGVYLAAGYGLVQLNTTYKNQTTATRINGFVLSGGLRF